MRKIFNLLFVLSLLAGKNCLALDTASRSPEHACTGEIRHTIIGGETLWGIARHYGQKMKAIADIPSNGITNPAHIYAGRTMIIPCRSVARTSNTLESILAGATRNSVSLAPETVDPDVSIAYMPILAMSGMNENAPANNTVAAAPPQPEKLPVPPPPIKHKRIKGYRLVLNADQAKEYGIIAFNRDLETKIMMFDSEQHEANGFIDDERHGLTSRATRRGKNIVLSVSLTELPANPLFTISIAGLKKPIDGNYFRANCEPIEGRFPGPDAFTRVMFTGIKLSANVALITLYSGGNLPLGIGVGFVLPLVHDAIQRHAQKLREDALARYQLVDSALRAQEFDLEMESERRRQEFDLLHQNPNPN